MKYNKYEEVTTTESTSIKELERDFRIFSILTWLVVLIALIMCLSNLKLQVKVTGLEEENKRLVEVIEEMKRWQKK